MDILLELEKEFRGLPDNEETAAKLFKELGTELLFSRNKILDVFLELNKRLHFGPLVFSRGVRFSYTSTAQSTPKEAVIQAIKRANPNYLMTDTERRMIKSLPDEVHIYHRRFAEDPRVKGWGLSWSISKTAQECMALVDRTQHLKPLFFETVIPKSEIFCMFLNRDAEILVDVPEDWPVSRWYPDIPDPDAFVVYLASPLLKAKREIMDGDYTRAASLK